MTGGREQGEQMLALAARTHDWKAGAGIDAIDERVVWEADEEGVTLWFRVEAA